MDFVRLWLGLLLPLVAALDFGYHHQEEMEAFLKNVAQNYSSITRLHSIGKSVKGRVRLVHFPKAPVLAFIHWIYLSFLPPFLGATQGSCKRVSRCLACWRFSAFVCRVGLFCQRSSGETWTLVNASAVIQCHWVLCVNGVLFPSYRHWLLEVCILVCLGR